MGKYVAKIHDGEIHDEGMWQTISYDSKAECLNALMLRIFRDLGDGDGENGGSGSLWNCAPKIYSVLDSGEPYCYAGKTYLVEQKRFNPYDILSSRCNGYSVVVLSYSKDKDEYYIFDPCGESGEKLWIGSDILEKHYRKIGVADASAL